MTDDSDFDKEAEREKLREKYERDENDRENTQRMSELLLKGATMTGKHCGECGDPIFRYDGQEFCPTCQREVGGNRAADRNEEAQTAQNQNPRTAQSDEAQTAQADAEADTTADRSDDSATSESDGEPRVEINDVRVADRHADRTDLRDPPSQSDGRTGDQQSAGRRNAAHDRASRRDPHGRSADGSHSATESAPEGRPSADDLGAARGSLVRTLTDLSRRAEETDDVSRTRDLLAATREAAEALAALDRANR